MVASFEYIEGVIAAYQRAAEANVRAPTRRGSVVELTSEVADEVMITADLHGNRKNFNAIKQIADLGAHPRRHLVMQEVCHGGPSTPSGGCLSYTMLEDVARLKVEFPDRVHFILSNHELAELIDYPILKAKRMLNVAFRLGLQANYGPAAVKVREAYLPFLRSCPLAVRIESTGVFISHSLPSTVDQGRFDATIFDRELTDDDLSERGSVFALVWGRDYRPENAAAFADRVGAKILIHGHDPCPEGFKTPNDQQIILDCCNDRAHYLILPVDETLSHAEMVDRIKPLC